MPVLYNTQSGLAENAEFNPELHEYYLIAPDGSLKSAPAAAAQDLLSKGYKTPTAEEIAPALKEAKYEPQGLKAAAEGLGRGVAGPLFTMAEQAMGVKPEDIIGREEQHPGKALAGEAVGLVGSGITGMGEGALLNMVGKKTAEKLSAQMGKGAASKIIATAAAGAVENMAYQSGVEAHKMIADDPGATADSAIAHVGLAGALGGTLGAGLGGASALWDTKLGAKATGFLHDFRSRMAEIKGEPLPEMPVDANAIYDPMQKRMRVPGSEVTSISDILGNQGKKELSETAGAKFADAIMEHASGKAAGAVVGGGVGAVTGHPFIGALIGERFLGPEINKVLPGIIKHLADNVANGVSGRAAVEYANAAMRGENLLQRSVNNLISGSADAIESPDIGKLKKKLEKIADNQDMLLEQSSKLGHYMPEHATALSATTSNAVNYLQSLKPQVEPAAPLDKNGKVNSVATARYDEALMTAQNPLWLLGKIKKGTITVNNIKDLNMLYPNMSHRMQQKILDGVVDHLHKDKSLPFKTQQGLSMFLGQSLNSALKPENIMAIQASFMPAQGPQGTAPPAKSTAKLSKIPEATISSTDAIAARRQNRIR